MKKVGDLMKEMGFNKNGSESAKEAFLKHLIKTSSGVSVQTPTEKKLIQLDPQKIIQFPKQMSFDFDDADLDQQLEKPRKSKQK
jgi:hypothetical protein